MKAIGIDLGTTYSAIAQWRVRPNGAESEVYNLNTIGRKACPSKVYVEEYNGHDNFIIGPAAITRGTKTPERYIPSVKRLMDENLPIDIAEKKYTPVEISAEIVKYLLSQVEQTVGPNTWVPEGIVVTVPYYFLNTQLSNTSDAIKKAIKDQFGDRIIGKAVKRYGKEITIDDIFLGLVPEPIAASFDYSFNIDAEVKNETIMVFDLGGGTFDLTIFKLSTNNNTLKYEVLAVDGNSRLGGEDFDESLLKFICEQEGINISEFSKKDQGNFYKSVIPEITELKHILAFVEKGDLIIPNILNGKNIDIEVSRNDLRKCLNGEEGNKIDYFSDISIKIDDVLTKANINIKQISSILLTGGSSKLVHIREELVKKGFTENQIRTIPAVDLAVARGAAIYAAYQLDKIKVALDSSSTKFLKDWNNIEIVERNPHDLGILVSNKFNMIIPNNSITPITKTNTYRPTRFSDDGLIAKLGKIQIVQGKPAKFSKIGYVDVGDIHTHGRARNNISVKITFLVDTTSIKVKIFVAQGNQDKSDINVEKELSLDSK